MPRMESFSGIRQTKVREHLREVKSGKKIVVRKHNRNLSGETRYVVGQDEKFHLIDSKDRDWQSGTPKKLLDDSITKATDYLDADIRGKINNKFTEKYTNKYLKDIPITDIFNIIKSEGIVPIMEDNTEWEGFIAGEKGRTEIALADVDSSIEKKGLTFYNEIENAMLVLSWYKMPSGNYEIVPYIS